MITEEQRKLMSDLDEISNRIAKNEGKDNWIALHDLNLMHCRRFIWNNTECHYFILPCHNFENLIMSEKIVEIVQKKQDLFGTNCTYDVLKGIYDILDPTRDFDSFVEMMSKEQFAYMGELGENGLKRDKVLRLDFFRMTDDQESEFIGGLFHAFKHFNLRGYAITSKQGEVELSWVNHFMDALARAFFRGTYDQTIDADRPHDRVSRINFLEHTYKFVFYYNDEADVYFLNTAYVED